MQKIDKFGLAVAIVASVILLIVGFVFGFGRGDAPLGFMLTVLWWLIIAGIAYGIVRTERERRERIRTVYVADHEMFNPEWGSIARPADPHSLARAVEETVRGLNYGFSLHELPGMDERPRFTRVIRTFAYDADSNEWSGEVVFVNAMERRPCRFENRAQLAFALTS